MPTVEVRGVVDDAGLRIEWPRRRDPHRRAIRQIGRDGDLVHKVRYLLDDRVRSTSRVAADMASFREAPVLADHGRSQVRTAQVDGHHTPHFLLHLIIPIRQWPECSGLQDEVTEILVVRDLTDTLLDKHVGDLHAFARVLRRRE